MTKPVEQLQRKVRQLDSDVLEIYEKLDAMSGVLEHHSVVLDEHTAILEHHSAVLDQHTAILEHHSAVLDEHTAILDQHTAALEGLDVRLTSVQESLIEVLRRLPEAC